MWLVHDVMGNVLTTQRSDATSVIQAGYRWLHDPAAIYADTARHLAETGLVPVTGLIRPPAAAMLAAPFSFLPGWMQVPAWTVADAAAAVIGLWIVQRYITRTRLEMAVLWAVAFYSPPLYAEVNAGQIGGFVLLFACLGLVTFRRRPALSGALVAAAASLKLYPALMVLGARTRWRPFLIAAGIAGVLLTIVALVMAIRNARWQRVLWLAAGLLFWLRQPCLLPFPNLWTIGALILFATCVLAAGDFAPPHLWGGGPQGRRGRSESPKSD